MQPKVGDKIENFTLQDQDGKDVSLTDFKGKPVVMFFYPRADTPGCTIEACGFRDHFKKLQKAGVVVLGVSRDTVKAQKKFAEKYDLNYPLLADDEMTLIKRFDLLKNKTMYGKPVTGVERTTFLIGPDGKLLHVFHNVKPEGHAEEVLKLLKARSSE
jgi:peroxiredoxin Q/BCP